MGGVGENIGKISGSYSSSTAVAEALFGGWMNSPGHRANIPNSDYTHFGIGGAWKDGNWYGVQVFGELTALLLESPSESPLPPESEW